MRWYFTIMFTFVDNDMYRNFHTLIQESGLSSKIDLYIMGSLTFFSLHLNSLAEKNTRIQSLLWYFYLELFKYVYSFEIWFLDFLNKSHDYIVAHIISHFVFWLERYFYYLLQEVYHGIQCILYNWTILNYLTNASYGL